MAPFIAACVWVVTAWVLSVVLTSKQSWPAAYVLIAVGVPLLLWLWHDLGPMAAFVGLVTGMVVLRWPVIYLGRWLKRRIGGA